MNRATVAIISASLLAVVAIVSVVLINDFNGKDTSILVAAIFGFATPVIGTLFVLAQLVINAEKTNQVANAVQEVQNQADSINKKVNGHLANLTRIVVDHAVTGEPIGVGVAAQLADRTSKLTGENIQINERSTRVTPPIAAGEVKTVQDARTDKEQETRSNP